MPPSPAPPPPPRLISLDHFRSRVYRPRLALIILLVLLSGCVTPPSASHKEDARAVMMTPTTQVAGAGRSAFVGKERMWRRSGENEDATTTATTRTHRLSWTPTAFNKWFSSSQDGSQKQRSTRSHRLAISLFLSPAIFPTLIQLHLLWFVRFVAGEIEGRVGANSNGRQVQQTASRGVLAVMFALLAATATILHPSTAQGLQRIAAKAVAGSETFSDPTTLFPCLWILLIESVPTWLSLLPLLVIGSKSGVIPRQVSVPSPSHLPSLVELLPFWLRAPLMPSEQERARRSAVLAGRSRRHGAFGRGALALSPTPNAAMLRLDEDMSSGNNSEASETTISHSRSATNTTATSTSTSTPLHSRTQSQSEDSQGTPLWTTLNSDGPSREAQRVLRLQQAMVDELERAGRLPASSTSRVALDGKTNLHQRHQRVQLPTSYFLSVILSMISSLSLIICYSLVTLKLPNLAPTSVPAIVSLLALRAEIGGLVKYWNEERRRVEGLEFVRRRWGGVVNTHHQDVASTCAICFETIQWSSPQEDGVRLDCQHELHAPCLVPWLMSQSFCPVCHRPLRPSGGASTGGGTPGHSRNGSVRRRRLSRHRHHHHHRSRSGGGGGDGPVGESAPRD